MMRVIALMHQGMKGQSAHQITVDKFLPVRSLGGASDVTFRATAHYRRCGVAAKKCQRTQSAEVMVYLGNIILVKTKNWSRNKR